MRSRNEIESIFQGASKNPFCNTILSEHDVKMDRQSIETCLPQRDFILALDQVKLINLEQDMIVTSYDLKHSHAIFEGHFPGLPIWPGIMQVEAVYQAASVLLCAKRSIAKLLSISQARFIHPISPQNQVFIHARLFNEKSHFHSVIGQCIHQDKICSVIWLELI